MLMTFGSWAILEGFETSAGYVRDITAEPNRLKK